MNINIIEYSIYLKLLYERLAGSGPFKMASVKTNAISTFIVFNLYQCQYFLFVVETYL